LDVVAQHRGRVNPAGAKAMLVAVVGPSGAGKDTLMGLARARLVGDARFVFAQRAITRPAEAGGEDHRALDAPGFAAERDAGGFALWWEAHGLSYGIPRAIEGDMAAGRVVVANLSRGVLAQADARYRLRVLVITAPVAVLATRLAARGREDAADIAARLAREAALPGGLDVTTVMNDATPEDGAARVVAALTRAAEDARRS
jgi:phosphonate metabolism protein PhnN/1,5-bisphosphokinase (PRPP-forming)